MSTPLIHPGALTLSVQGVAAAVGVLLGLELSSRLASRLKLEAARIWNLGFVTLVTYFVSARLLVILFNLDDFAAHPVWMLGLTAVRDPRCLGAAPALAICAGCGYISAWRLPWARTLDALAPGAGVTLAAIGLSPLLGVHAKSLPMSAAFYTFLLHLIFAGLALGLALYKGPAGSAGAAWLSGEGLGGFLREQLRALAPGQPLVFSTFTPGQLLAIAAIAAGALLWLRQAVTPATSKSAVAAPSPLPGTPVDIQ